MTMPNLMLTEAEQDNKVALFEKWIQTVDSIINNEEYVKSLDYDLSKFLLHLLREETNNNKINAELRSDFEGLIAYQMISKRSKAIGLGMTEFASVLLSTVVQTPADVTMYVSYLRAKQTHVSLVDICNIFGLGFFSKEATELLWSAQKFHNKNLLDIHMFK